MSVELIEPETKRLRLRQWRAEDREPFAALNADARVMEFFPSPLSHSDSGAFADHLERLISERGWGLWAAELKDSREFIGFVGLHVPPPEVPLSPCVEIGWRLAHRYWGHGFATEAATSALQVGFDVLELDDIFSFTSVLNTKSCAVMERLGMVREPDTFEHPKVPAGNRLRTHCAYRLSRERWRAVAGKSATSSLMPV